MARTIVKRPEKEICDLSIASRSRKWVAIPTADGQPIAPAIKRIDWHLLPSNQPHCVAGAIDFHNFQNGFSAKNGFWQLWRPLASNLSVIAARTAENAPLDTPGCVFRLPLGCLFENPWGNQTKTPRGVKRKPPGVSSENPQGCQNAYPQGCSNAPLLTL